MKKAASLILALVMCLSLCACGNSRVKKNAATAPNLDLTAYYSMCLENEAKAKAEFHGNIYRYTGKVFQINSNYCVVEQYTKKFGRKTIYVYLDSEDLIKLSKGEKYTFAGEFKHRSLTPSLSGAVIAE